MRESRLPNKQAEVSRKSRLHWTWQDGRIGLCQVLKAPTDRAQSRDSYHNGWDPDQAIDLFREMGHTIWNIESLYLIGISDCTHFLIIDGIASS